MWSELERRSRRLPGAQAHGQRAAWHPACLPREGRCARPVGLPLPPALSHGSRHVPRGARRCVALTSPYLPAGGDLSGYCATRAACRARAAEPRDCCFRFGRRPRRSVSRLSAPCAWPTAYSSSCLNKLVLLDRLESQNASGGDVLAWNLEAWVGRDLGKLWIRSEGERQSGRIPSAPSSSFCNGRDPGGGGSSSRERAATRAGRRSKLGRRRCARV